MPNGELRSIIFQTSAIGAATHIVVVNVSPALRDSLLSLARKTRPSVTWFVEGVVAPSENATDLASAKDAYLAARTRVVRDVMGSVLESERRHGHLRTVFLLLGEPSSFLEAVTFSELGIDLTLAFERYSASLPTILRIAADTHDRTGARVFLEIALALLERYYFTGEERPRAGWLRPNDFDSAVFRPGDGRFHLDWFLKKLLALHDKETRAFKGAALTATPPLLIMEELMKRDRSLRRLDWLGVGHYPFFPRLWTDGLKSLVEFLELRPGDAGSDPWAKYTARKRETSWTVLPALRAAAVAPRPVEPYDLVLDDYPFRVNKDDSDGNLLLSMWLARKGRLSPAAALLSRLEPERLLRPYLRAKWLGLVLMGTGRADEASVPLNTARAALLEQVKDPKALPAPIHQEIAHLSLLLRDLASAEQHARAALAADPGFPAALRTHVESIFLQGRPADAVASLRRLTGFMSRPDPGLADLMLSVLPREQDTDDPVLLEERSLACIMTGRPELTESALEAARKAYARASESPHALVVLVTALTNSGRNDELKLVMDEARKKGIARPERPASAERGRLLRFPIPRWKPKR